MKWEKKNKKESQLLLIICLLYLMIWDARLHSLNIHDIELTCILVVFVQFFPVQHLEIVRQRQSIEKSNEKLKKKIQTLNKSVWIGISVIMIFQYAQWLFKVIFTKNQRCMANIELSSYTILLLLLLLLLLMLSFCPFSGIYSAQEFVYIVEWNRIRRNQRAMLIILLTSDYY